MSGYLQSQTCVIFANSFRVVLNTLLNYYNRIRIIHYTDEMKKMQLLQGPQSKNGFDTRVDGWTSTKSEHLLIHNSWFHFVVCWNNWTFGFFAEFLTTEGPKFYSRPFHLVLETCLIPNKLYHPQPHYVWFVKRNL